MQQSYQKPNQHDIDKTVRTPNHGDDNYNSGPVEDVLATKTICKTNNDIKVTKNRYKNHQNQITKLRFHSIENPAQLKNGLKIKTNC